jgi:hypothetical protein
MAVTAVGASFKESGVGAGLTPDVVGTTTTDDFEVAIAATFAQDIALSTANGYAEVSGGQSEFGSAGTGIRGELFQRIRNGDTADPVLTDSGAGQLGFQVAFRGVDTVDPIDALAVDSESSTTSGEAPGLTTTTDNAMVVVFAFGNGPNSDANEQFSGWANASLESITELADWSAAVASIGLCVGVAYGIKATAGAVSATTFTKASASDLAYITLALKDASAGGGAVTTRAGINRGLINAGLINNGLIRRSMTKLNDIWRTDRRVIVPVGIQLQGA